MKSAFRDGFAPSSALSSHQRMAAFGALSLCPYSLLCRPKYTTKRFVSCSVGSHTSSIGNILRLKCATVLVLLVIISLCLVAEKKKMKEKVKRRRRGLVVCLCCVVLDLMLNNGKFIEFVIV